MTCQLLSRFEKQFYTCIALVLIVLLAGCKGRHDESLRTRSEFAIKDRYFEGKATLEILPPSRGFKVILKDSAGVQLDRTVFRYDHYHFDTADVNRDGRTEILVGLIKKTTFDLEKRKRLFILRIDEGQLRPLWLGSKVCQELIDFRTLQKGLVQTLERTSSGKYSIGVYEWQGFGLTLIHYTHNEKNYSDALKIFGA